MRGWLLPLLGLLLLAGCGGGDPQAATGPAGGSTLRSTLADRDGDGLLERARGEPLRARRDLGGGGATGRTLAAFGQITDSHVRDEESPGRVPFLDRIGTPFTSTFRPQEALSAQVLDATVRALDAERPQAVVVTGDFIDSAQADELDQAVAALHGGRVDPDTGRDGYDGVQAADNPDPLYFRPDNDAPREPGLLSAAQRPFQAGGLSAPWFPVLGNHDLLVQGEVPSTARIDAVATGGRLLTGLDPSLRPPSGDIDPAAAVDALLSSDSPGRSQAVPPDSGRRHLSAAEVVAGLRRAAGLPSTPSRRLDYTFDIGPSVRGIALDLVRRDGGSRGVVSARQLAWLRRELDRAGSRWVFVFSHQALDASEGGEAALAALDASPRVVAAVSGHRHRNVIEPRRTRRGGYWLIGTSSLADYPQQARMFRLVEAGDGLALETWMVDQDGRGLAGVSRELAFLDAQGGRPQDFAGGVADRNVRLSLPPAP